MMYLLDTNVVSELRKSKTRRVDRHVYNWAKNISAGAMFLSAISVLELELGVLLLERRDRAQGAVLRSWMEKHVLPAFQGRVLAVDTEVARKAAGLHVPNPCSHRDAMIAATALVHGMTVATRNVADFHLTGVALINPWE
ncbi:MAG: type II toxin-antitoxin system VapC family toxin [Terracidiphilus sp.]